MDDKRKEEDFVPDEIGPPEKLSADEEKLLDKLGLFGAARRQFLGQSIAGGLGFDHRQTRSYCNERPRCFRSRAH